MSNTNETSKFGRAPQVRELRDNELQKVSGGAIIAADFNMAEKVVELLAPPAF